MRTRASIDDPRTSDLLGLDLSGLEAALAEHDPSRFRAVQAYRWMYARGVLDPRSWTDYPRALRERLAASVRIDPGRIAGRTEALDGTVKYRVALAGGGAVESVWIVQRGRCTLCVSSQVGCAIGCDFCLTARMGLERHLTAGEIVGQVLLARADRGPSGPFHVVFMGMGEPLHNYDAVLGAVRLLADPAGLAVGHRRVTLSTSGLVPGIERLAAEPIRPRLAVSLNATTDAVRDRLMPINRKYPIAALVAACRAFARTSGERVTLEYVLLAGVNDSADDADRLARLARGVPARVNLIPFNEVEGWLPYRRPARGAVIAFRDRVAGRGARATIRWSRGLDARAACGQLALLERDGP
jgi:23S rRNA (adenine2503-C2)-methyltransferase